MIYARDLVDAQPWLNCRVAGTRCPGSVCCGHLCLRLVLNRNPEIRKQESRDWYDETDEVADTLTHHRVLSLMEARRQSS